LPVRLTGRLRREVALEVVGELDVDVEQPAKEAVDERADPLLRTRTRSKRRPERTSTVE
jgi:hypothetical protein